MLLLKALCLLDLLHELPLCKYIVIICIEILMDCDAVFLVELSTVALENTLQFTDVDVAGSIDITTPKQFIKSDSSVFKDIQESEHGPVLEWRVVVRPIGIEVLLATQVIGFEGILHFGKRDVPFLILIEYENDSCYLTSAQLKFEVVDHALEPVSCNALLHFAVTNPKEGLGSQSLLVQALFELL